MKHHYCVIMAGGVGSRFWPMSRTSHPKQFIDVLGIGRSLLQQTYDRYIGKLCPAENIIVVTNVAYKELVKKQLPDIPEENILCEPLRKNTAPCIAYAAYKIAKKDPKAVMVVAPSDHLILKEKTFVKAIRACYQKAQSEDCLITLGIRPMRPDTGYGYIQYIESPVKEKDPRIKQVKTFTEKPDLEMAQFFLQSGDFLWNSGIFIWSAASIIKALEKHLPDEATLFSNGTDSYYTSSEKKYIDKVYEQCKSISVDYGVMEKADNAYVRSSAIGWSDLGTWGSLYQHMEKDKNKNAVVGKNVMLFQSTGCIVHVPKNKLVVMEGLEDYIVVEAEDILLICKKQDEQQIRNFVNEVKARKGEKFV
ncbi:MAG TPA: mannose-1-phosphate guanylyltransferase [Bacteroidia bacterium]|jgi:mannose-1-phosphate guanylyltransferase|nr:mannose-1-phosphate guanylyltransferase [Bacteroidia bacterium]